LVGFFAAESSPAADVRRVFVCAGQIALDVT
jgi:hypothetical protein